MILQHYSISDLFLTTEVSHLQLLEFVLDEKF